MARKRKTYDDDDGRVIANMNVEGMPWYTSPAPGLESERKEGDDAERPPQYYDVRASRREELSIFFGTMRAGCLLAAIFSAVILVVVLIVLIGSGNLFQ